jgi:prepilin signal peptidase PulO-like enzyme (type II secretory pathway)
MSAAGSFLHFFATYTFCLSTFFLLLWIVDTRLDRHIPRRSSFERLAQRLLLSMLMIGGLWVTKFVPLTSVSVMGSLGGLFALSIVDYQTKTLPNDFLLALVFFGLLGKSLTKDLSFLYSIFTLFAVCLFLKLYLYLRGEKTGIGAGDLKLFLACGIFISLNHIPFFLFFTGCLGSIFGLWWKKSKKDNLFPFGLIIASVLCLWVLWNAS